MTQAVSPSALALPTVAKPRGFMKWIVAITASLGALLEVIDSSIVNVALTDMQSTLGATLSEIGWVVSSYAIANVIIIPLTAWLGDTFGKKAYFVFSLVAFTVSSVLCGVSTSLPMLIIARILQGLGGGGLLAKAQTILFETFPKEEQGMAQALFGACVIAGPTIGPTLGGYLTTNLNWRWIFFINVPIGIVAVLMGIAFLPTDGEKKASIAKVDWLGIALLVIGVGSLQTLLEQGNDDDWFSSKFITTLAVSSTVGILLFVWRQLAVDQPVVDLRVLRYRSLAAGSAFSMVLGMALYGALFAVPIFCQTILGFTAQQTGMVLLPGALASAVMMPVMGKVVNVVDPRIIIGVGALVLTVSMAMLSNINPGTGTDEMFWPMIIRGIGTVMMFLPLSIAALGPLPKKDIAAGSGFYNLTRQLGGSIGIALLTTLLSQRQAFHRAVLVEKIPLSDVGAQQRIAQYAAGFLARGSSASEAHDRAVYMLDGAVNRQAAIISFGDTFYFVGGILLLSLPLLLMLGKGGNARDLGGAH